MFVKVTEVKEVMEETLGNFVTKQTANKEWLFTFFFPLAKMNSPKESDFEH